MTDDDHPELHTITMAVREADRHFERVGGSSRHWVRDCFLPMLEKHGLRIARLLDGIEEVPYRTPACDKHLSRNEEHECPWCKLDAYANEEICLECGRVGPKPPPPAISCCPERRTIRRAELEAENERLASRLDCARRLAHSWIDTPFTSMDRDTMRTLGNELLRTIGEKWIAESNPGSAVEKPVHPRYTRCPGTIDGEHQWERWENESTGETGMECAVCHDGYPTLSE